MNFHLPALLALFEVSRTANSMCVAGVILIAVGVLAAKNDVARARGLDKVVALGYLCFAAPLAVFGAEHLSAAQGIAQGVPKFMPWHLFWAYFVGFALIAASLSIAQKIQERWPTSTTGFPGRFCSASFRSAVADGFWQEPRGLRRTKAASSS